MPLALRLNDLLGGTSFTDSPAPQLNEVPQVPIEVLEHCNCAVGLLLSAVARNRTYSAVRARMRFAGSAWLAPVLS
jgi:hypothetical protein